MTAASPFARPAPEPTAPPARLAVGVAEAATLIGVSARSVWAMIARGELRPAKVGRRRVLLIEDLENWLRARRA